MKEFAALAAIPRPSKHEEAIGKYLVERLNGLGLSVERDPIGNVIADLKASDGCEHIPRTILQAHMDMVCVADDGVTYNPLTDPIKLIRDEEYLRADGTSLGADDGMGVAIIISVIKNFVEEPTLKHGAIRAIFTVDEEIGMFGAKELDVKYLNDAHYLINCDSEDANDLVIGSAGSTYIDFTRRLDRTAPRGAHAFCLTIEGLKGGHSGLEIHTGRANAIKVLAELLSAIEKAGAVEIAKIKGGKATNAIADSAEAIIVTTLDAERLTPIVNLFADDFNKKYGAIEHDFKLTAESVEMPANVIGDSGNVVELLMSLRSGMIAMATPDLTETSANIGIVSMDDENLTVRYFPRSSVDAKLIEIINEVRAIAERCKFDVAARKPSAAWTPNFDSRLARLMNSVYTRQNNRSMNVKVIHAGLESSYFFEKNRALDIVSIGTTNEHIHSPRERLKLSTVPVQFNLIRTTLIELAANV